MFKNIEEKKYFYFMFQQTLKKGVFSKRKGEKGNKITTHITILDISVNRNRHKTVSLRPLRFIN